MVSTRAAGTAGFTLPEVITVVAIVAVLAAVAAPSFSQLVGTQRVRAASSELYNGLLRTRSEAIKRNLAVTMTPQTDSAWQHGWTIPNPTLEADMLESQDRLTLVTISGPSNVVFLPSGRVQGAARPEFEVSATGVDYVRCIAVDLSGRPHLTSAACPP